MPTPQIPTISEARRALRTLDEFLSGLEQVFSPQASLPLMQAMRNAAAHTITEQTPNLPGLQNPPKTWADRICRILEEEHRPLAPREIVRVYVAKGWPVGIKNYKHVIRGTLYQLMQSGRVLRTDAGYVAKPSTERGAPTK